MAGFYRKNEIPDHLQKYFKPAEIGLEASLDDYVSQMVLVFREVWRVLRDDGTCWVNLGDSYAGSWGNQGRKEERGTQRPINGPMIQSFRGYAYKTTQTGKLTDGLKPKDLMGVPWRVALALQADGWYLRSDIIWVKPNPMPESISDRPTKAHEYIFLLTKNEKYFYDAEVVKEGAERAGSYNNATPQNAAYAMSRIIQVGPTRNLRSVWQIATEAFSGRHFATFPTEIVKRCILAGTSEKGCCSAMIKKLRLKKNLTPDQQQRVEQFLKKKGVL